VDIGTNSTKLLVGAVRGGRVRVIVRRLVTTRIGAGLAGGGDVAQAAVVATISAIRAYGRLARRHGCEHLFAYATWALRRAPRSAAILRRIERQTGVRVRVLSARQEARFAYTGARGCLQHPKPFTLLVDVGGGSIELVFAQRGRIARTMSLPLGALRSTERYVRHDPPAAEELAAIRRRADSLLASFFHRCPRVAPARLDLVASGGTVTTLARMLRGADAARGTAVRRADIARLARRCGEATLAQRRRMRGLPADRADIITAGLVVVLAVMDHARKRVLRVNPGGVREGALLHVVERGLRW
jgi:exopolyphosphatase/guanosine-5'-triphosphate,3'-diphosphate pyrophosphatase